MKPADFCGHEGTPKIETDVTLLGLSRDSLGGTYEEKSSPLALCGAEKEMDLKPGLIVI